MGALMYEKKYVTFHVILLNVALCAQTVTYWLPREKPQKPEVATTQVHNERHVDSLQHVGMGINRVVGT